MGVQVGPVFKLPKSRALFQGTAWPAAGATFKSADDCLAFMFGRPQHDAHVRARRSHFHVTAQLATYPAREQAVRELVEQWRVDREIRLAAEAPATRAFLDKANRDFCARYERRKAECVSLGDKEKLHG